MNAIELQTIPPTLNSCVQQALLDERAKSTSLAVQQLTWRQLKLFNSLSTRIFDSSPHSRMTFDPGCKAFVFNPLEPQQEQIIYTALKGIERYLSLSKRSSIHPHELEGVVLTVLQATRA